MIHTLFNSRTIEKSEAKQTCTVTFYSLDREELELYVASNYAQGMITDLGEVKTTRFRTEGTIWYCDVTAEYEVNEAGISFVTPKDDASPQKHTLRVINLPQPLRLHANYRCFWNSYLWCSESVTNAPASAVQKTYAEPWLEGDRVYTWTASFEKPEPGTYCEQEVGEWHCIFKTHDNREIPLMPDTETFDFHVYQVTEYGTYSHESKALWVVRQNLDSIRNKPILGDFGIKGTGNCWKCDDATIEPDGDKWRATLVWTFSPGGWRSELYPPSLRS